MRLESANNTERLFHMSKIMPQNHSYDSVRNAVIEVLITYNNPKASDLDYNSLSYEVATILKKKDGIPSDGYSSDRLSDSQLILFYDVFWDLFRQGIINLGQPRSSSNAFPAYRLSSFGKLALGKDDFCFFHDVISYEKCLKHEIKEIDPLTLIYLKEAMQAYLVGCYRSSAVMTGVALEDSLDSLYGIITKSRYERDFRKISSQKTLYQKFVEFKKQLDKMRNELPDGLNDGLDSNLGMIFEFIRTYRNESGHPSDRKIEQEQCFINLRLFIPCCKKIYELRKWFTSQD